MTDPYETLGLTPQASTEEIKQKYRKMSLRYHPDRNPEDGGKTFKEINKAYEILSNEDSRKDYNMMKKMGIPLDSDAFKYMSQIFSSSIIRSNLLAICLLWLAIRREAPVASFWENN